ncbi:MAG: hypothetical protein A2420_02910 [Candidatus Moranbacteria bacterium RIFOXYC1_FULL_44_13]|nr:MAG: hypothetical protein A2184_02210 [Candidatus Moranbacteria bacterium RIFOXYA1_FULL_44_7]OGI32504.1 MAG: hypothetical protein A2420_02910 [Candidatus Moranbacteria bacterium RIFOXYC1_FULL_44_13]
MKMLPCQRFLFKAVLRSMLRNSFLTVRASRFQSLILGKIALKFFLFFYLPLYDKIKSQSA